MVISEHINAEKCFIGGGGDGDDDDEETHIPPIDSTKNANFGDYTNMGKTFEFKCKRTDGKYFFSLPTTRIFDVLYSAHDKRGLDNAFFLCRHDKQNVSCDKVLACYINDMQKL